MHNFTGKCLLLAFALIVGWVVWPVPIEAGEDLLLEVHALGNGLDRQVHFLSGQGRRQQTQTREDTRTLSGCQFAPLDESVQARGNGLAGPLKSAAIGIGQHDFVAGHGADLGDATSHSPGADNGDSFQRHVVVAGSATGTERGPFGGRCSGSWGHRAGGGRNVSILKHTRPLPGLQADIPGSSPTV